MTCYTGDFLFSRVPAPAQQYDAGIAQRIMNELAARAKQEPYTVTGLVIWQKHGHVLALWKRATAWCRLSNDLIPTETWHDLLWSVVGQGA